MADMSGMGDETARAIGGAAGRGAGAKAAPMREMAGAMNRGLGAGGPARPTGGRGRAGRGKAFTRRTVR